MNEFIQRLVYENPASVYDVIKLTFLKKNITMHYYVYSFTFHTTNPRSTSNSNAFVTLHDVPWAIFILLYKKQQKNM